ncbi:MAG TPA: glycosyltransferase [Tepidisphaeraceae bacterium]|jgi:GT2 family glycosyltransferase
MIDLTIVLPTCNRAALLQNALKSIVRQTTCSFELIVVDGASNDATFAVLQPFQHLLGDRMSVFGESRRGGFVKACNLGLRAARGRNLCWLNDDARPVGAALDRAVELVDRDAANVLAMFHHWQSPKNVAHQADHAGRTFSLCHVRGTLYANFPIARRTTFERLGFLDERFRFCAADPDFSLSAWNAGLQVKPAWDVCIDHDQHADDRREEDSPAMMADNARLFEKWDLPAKNLTQNDFDPHQPCTLRGLRTTDRLAA